eukprot:NODE_1795_length_840_cov_72.136536_g1415_i0.p1 GENE.NODE_1795_length_840_cov_72.136536_g1415_i0~~NODE_1795_length_840_cov_72.136536_g1415_i0.p1  ORF type:complete len:199 (-),score=34.20 NODE_1795_length_840_cov_72.136536_g1415_i0:179-775(-)
MDACLHQFLLNSTNRDHLARLVEFACIALRGVGGERQAITATLTAIRTTRLTNTWLQHVPLWTQLSQMSEIEPIYAILQMLSKFFLLVWATLQNISWLGMTRIMNVDAGRFRRLAFKFYTLGWACELVTRVLKTYGIPKRARQRSPPKVSLAQSNRVQALKALCYMLEGAQAAGIRKSGDVAVGVCGVVSAVIDIKAC